MVKDGWKRYSTAEIGTFAKGSGISREQSNSGNLPAVRYGELYTTHNYYVREFASHISSDVALQAHKIGYGDLLFTCSGETKEEIGKCVAVVTNTEAYAGGDLIIITPTCKMHPLFMGYALNTPQVIHQRAQLAQGDSIVHISTESIKSLEFDAPEYPEQCRIAEVLSDIDELIINLEQLISKKKDIRRGTIQEYITGNKRLPGFEGDWKYRLIGDMTHVSSGGTPSTQVREFWGGDIPWMNSGEVNKKFVYSVQGRITKKGLESSSAHMIPMKCVLIGLAGQGKTRGTAAINFVPLCTNQSIGAIYPSEEFDSLFLYYLMDSKYAELRELSSGDGGRGGLTKALLESVEVFIPAEIKEQEAVSSFIFDMDSEIVSLENKLYKYKQIKSGMMDELLTGKIRLMQEVQL